MEIQDDTGDVRPGGELGRVGLCGRRREAYFQQFLGSSGVGLVGGPAFGKYLAERAEFLGVRIALQRPAPSPSEAGVIRAILGEHAGGEGAGGFDVGWVVEHHERLLRDVRTGTVGAGFLTARRVEGEHARMQETALPPDVEAAAILRLVFVGHVFAHGEVEVLPITIWLVGLHARAANLGRE